MRRRRGLSRDYWWLLLILGLGLGPVIVAAFLAVGMVVLASSVYIVPGRVPGGPTPAPSPTPALPLAPPASGGPLQFRVTVEGDGQVYVSPPGSGCSPGQTCAFGYNAGDQITLAAVAGFSPGSNARFAGWDGDCNALGGEPYPTLVMDAPKDCIARFTPP